MVKMVAVISPAKTLDFETDAPVDTRSDTRLQAASLELINQLRACSIADIQKMMKLSEKLATLNVARYESFSPDFTQTNSKQAVFAFQGDVYAGLSANTLTEPQINGLQDQLRILSGLYGLLRPFDAIQPYRLEMGTKLSNTQGTNLYQFWGERITQTLNEDLALLDADYLINLASTEYFKAVKPASLNVPVITPVFLDEKNGAYKVISFYAKKARGLMVRYLAEHNPTELSELKAFNYSGYQYNEAESSEFEWVFKRPEQTKTA